MEFQMAYRPTKKPTIDCGKTLTEQSHKNQCDINRILDDYRRTGLINHAKNNEGRYDDVTGYDFQKAMETVANVKSMFEGLPAEMRKEFGNDAVRFLDFVQNPANEQKMAKMGILRGNDGIDISGAPSGAPVRAPGAAVSGDSPDGDGSGAIQAEGASEGA